ncbi:DeoR/GlpR family DNA-binding transcription regulator [Aureimonas frigidaquae]|uniref:Glycerol-3-phosphate transcriptional regulator protein n=1 Tax=Aureimonas frigidaquae TaxID=424757 RepID=A0A0P0Z273_9HYPH|nr:DeoR/GlpR family DNA-binding transcription regulator [Aureimonas frigidaquae]BAT28198.1 glycerol-3-phosphate transcriptional regulator protein [Aureimonas frigidaquae]
MAASPPPAQIRMEAILARLNDGGSITVSEIARSFGISDMTVRRDLAELERNGLLERVHGGAVAPLRGPLAVIDDAEPAFEQRLRHNAPAKRAIAMAAAGLLTGRMTLAMDVGTTVLELARRVVSDKPPKGLRLFTNSLRVAQLSARAGVTTYLPGGLVRGEEMSLTGQAVIAEYSNLYFDAVLLGASGLTEEGIFDYAPEEAEIKRVFIKRAAQRILLIDASKFRRLSTVCFASLSDIDLVVTDAPPPDDLVEALKQAGTGLVVADPVAEPVRVQDLV